MKKNHPVKLLLLFILLNSLKITLIYFYLADIKTDWYVARFILTLGFFGSLWIVISPFKKLTFIIYLLQFTFFFANLSYFGFF